MVRIEFHESGPVGDHLFRYAVVMARYKQKWIFARHRERSTWEIPGGRREENEMIAATASRELHEETGAEDFSIVPVCAYSVDKDGERSYGHLFFAEVERLGPLPDSEIAEIGLFESMPESLTYPLIQPCLFERVREYLSSKN